MSEFRASEDTSVFLISPVIPAKPNKGDRSHTIAGQSNRVTLPWLLGMLMTVLSVAPLNAAEVSFSTTVLNSFGPFASSFDPGDIVTISYELDATVVDTNPDPNTGFYRNATQALNVAVPDLTLVAEFSGGDVSTFNNTANPDDQIFIFGTFNNNGSTLGGELIQLVELDYIGEISMIDDDSLPAEFPRDPNRVTLFLGTQSGFTQVELSPNILALTPSELISELSDLVMSINLAAGIANSYDSKLNEAVRALDDANQNNDVAAVNAMYAFCNSVEAQRGNKISDSDASELIDAANQVIASIDEFAAPCL